MRIVLAPSRHPPCLATRGAGRGRNRDGERDGEQAVVGDCGTSGAVVSRRLFLFPAVAEPIAELVEDALGSRFRHVYLGELANDSPLADV